MTSQRSAHAINSMNHIAGYVVLPAIAIVRTCDEIGFTLYCYICTVYRDHAG